MSNIVSYETVVAAAESLSKQDKRQSVRYVIAELGGGSPNAVLPLLNQLSEKTEKSEVDEPK